jgi:hypothetical protein
MAVLKIRNNADDGWNLVGGVGYTNASLPLEIVTASLTLRLNYETTDFSIAASKLTITDGGIDHDALANYVASDHINWAQTGAENIHDDRIASTAITQWEGSIDHDALTNYLASDHINWAQTGAEDIHVDRITSAAVTQHEGDIDHDALTNYVASEHVAMGNIDHGSIAGLDDDDHSKYPLVTNFEADRATIASRWTDLTSGGDTSLHYHTDVSYMDHGGLLGLGDDDHAVYVLTDGTRSLFGLTLASPLIVNDGQTIVYNDTLGSLGWGEAGGGVSIAASVTTATWGRFLDDVAATNVQSALDTIDDYAVEVVQGTSEPSTTYAGMIWVDEDGVGAGVQSYISDSDGDTSINCEVTSDEDYIHFNQGGNLRGKMTTTSLIVYGNTATPAIIQLAADQGTDNDDWWAMQAADSGDFGIAAWSGGLGAGYVNGFNMDNNGVTTSPGQPWFKATMDADQTAIATGGERTLQFDVVGKDVGSNFNTSTYTFTAPVDGSYAFHLTVKLYDIQTDADYITIGIITSNETYIIYINPGGFDTNNLDGWNLFVTALADMDAADTAYCTIRQWSGTTGQMDAKANHTWWHGYLLG